MFYNGRRILAVIILMVCFSSLVSGWLAGGRDSDIQTGAGRRNQQEPLAPFSGVSKARQDGPAPTTRPRKAGPSPPPAPMPVTRPQTVTPTPGAQTQFGWPSAAADSNAGAPVAEEVDEGDVVRIDSNLVIVPASVVDSRGRAIAGLNIEDFELRVDGQVKPIGDLSRSEIPVHIAVLFDNSASLSAARDFEKQAATRFFHNLVRPIDRAAIFSISTVPTLEQSLTNDVQRLVRTIESFGKPDGATALFDTVAQAADYLRPLSGRKVIVIISDGTDTVSDVSLDEALQRAMQADCQIYVVQTGQLDDSNLRDPVSERGLETLAGQTGGAVYVPRTAGNLDGAFTQISLDVAHQYLLSYYPEEERKDKYFRFINLRVKTRPDLRVRARRGFYPGSEQNGAATLSENKMTGVGRSAQSDLGLAAGVARNPAQKAGAFSSITGKSQSVAQGGAGLRVNGPDMNFDRRIGPPGPDEEEKIFVRNAATGIEVTAPAVKKPISGGLARTPVPAARLNAAAPPAHAPAPVYGPPAGTTSVQRQAGERVPNTNNESQKWRAILSPMAARPRVAAAAKPRTGHPGVNWFVICGSFPKTGHEQAKQLVVDMRARGYDVDIVDTNEYPKFRRNFLAVVMGPYSKNQAESLRGRSLAEVAQGCYVKSGW